jgi:sialate O-acetylesterase
VRCAADARGKWRVRLPEMEACAEPRTLLAECGGKRIEVGDVLVGEVWLASGQSNMDCPLVGSNTRYRDRQGSLVAQMTRKPLVRYVRSTGAWSRHPLERAQRPLVWRTFTPENLLSGNSCSAVAAYFALDIHSALGVPVGIVGAYCGGTNIDAWTPASGTASRPELRDISEWTYYDKSNWPTNFNTYPWRSPAQQPAVLWNGLVAPLAPYSCRGMIWYQGCHNCAAGEWSRYCSKMHALFNGWKREFENENFVIRFAQLATGYGTVCQMQAKFEREQSAAAMAVIHDVGNIHDIHPWEKQTVGRRLAVHALKRDYGFADIQDNSPSVREVVREGTNLVVVCRDAKKLYVYNEDRSVQSNFEISGRDGRWVRAAIVNIVPAKNAAGQVNYNSGALTDPDRIVLCAPGVEEPVGVRYLYSRPYRGALYNEVNLPLGAFVLDIR